MRATNELALCPADEIATLRSVVDGLPLGVCGLDADGRVVLANRAAAAALGTGDAALAGRALEALLPDLPPDEAGGGRGRVLLRRSPSGEARVLQVATRDLGTPPAAVRRLVFLSSLADPPAVERDAVSGLPVDATTRIVGGLAHELRNPLAAVQALADVLLVELAPGDPRHECATRIRREVGRIETFVRAALRLAQIAPGRSETLDAGSLVCAAAALAGGPPLAAPAAAVRCLGDRHQLVECLAALLANAAEAGASSGGVRIGLEHATDLEGARWVRIVVQDDGAGVPAAQRGRIFEPFVTTKPGRLGFGLAMARKLAALNGGRLELGDTSPLGSRFELWLPEAPA